MSHHTGTLEEAAAATAAALAQRSSNTQPRTRSDGDAYSDAGRSAGSTPSPGRRLPSVSPSTDLPQIPLLSRHSTGEYSLLGSRTLPPHIRSDLQHHSPRSPTVGSASPSSTSFSGPINSHRPSLTSHPAMYGPPSILEPPTNHDSRSTGSGSGSPHLGSVGSVGWQSPAPLGSPVPHDAFMYSDVGFGHGASHWSFSHSNMRRPLSTEPEQYDTKVRALSNEVWSGSF